MFLLLLIAPKQKNFASRKIGSLCGGWRKPAPALLYFAGVAGQELDGAAAAFSSREVQWGQRVAARGMSLRQ